MWIRVEQPELREMIEVLQAAGRTDLATRLLPYTAEFYRTPPDRALAYVRAAHRMHAENGELEIDLDDAERGPEWGPEVKENDEGTGAYVMAWRWVDAQDAQLEPFAEAE